MSPSFRCCSPVNIYWLFLVSVASGFLLPLPKPDVMQVLQPLVFPTHLNFSVCGHTLSPGFVVNLIYKFWFCNLVLSVVMWYLESEPISFFFHPMIPIWTLWDSLFFFANLDHLLSFLPYNLSFFETHKIRSFYSLPLH